MKNKALEIRSYTDIRRGIQEEIGEEPIAVTVELSRKRSFKIEKVFCQGEICYVATFNVRGKVWQKRVDNVAGHQIVGLENNDTADLAYLIFLIAKYDIVGSWITTYEYRYYRQLFHNVEMQKKLMRMTGEMFCD